MISDRRKEALEVMERLYRKFHRKLFLYALTYLEDDEDALDIVSEVFMSLWNRWENGDMPIGDPPLAYIYRMVKGRCIDKVRHEGVKSRYLQQMEHDRFDNIADVMEYERKVELLASSVKELPEPGQTILRYCYFDKMTYQQAADKLHLSLPMVKKHMANMFQMLREKLKNNKTG